MRKCLYINYDNFVFSGCFAGHLIYEIRWKKPVSALCADTYLNDEYISSDTCLFILETHVLCVRCVRKRSYDHLQQHKSIHIGDKPYVCTFCEKSFMINSILQRHVLIHTGDKLYACILCEKAFIKKSGLKPHMLIHTGDKPHVLPVMNGLP